MERISRKWSKLAVVLALCAIGASFSQVLNCRLAQAQQNEDPPPPPPGPTYPYVTIDDDGFSPSEVGYDEETDDTFYATFHPGDFYIPDPITFSWSVTSIQCDSGGSGSYEEADEYTYYCEWGATNQSSFDVAMYIYAPGDWVVYVDCVATYPDGYTRVFPKELKILASNGSDKQRKG
jgi:hypothetical protein